MIDKELQPTQNFVLYTTPNGEVKLEVVSILEITGFKLFPFWKQFKKKVSVVVEPELPEKFGQFQRFRQNGKEIREGIDTIFVKLCESFVFFVVKT